MGYESYKLQREIVDLMPSLRAFSRTLTRNPTDADDLLQEGLLKALVNLHQFTPGTNLKAWMFTIVRNTFYTNYKKRRREVASPFEDTGSVSVEPTQDWSLTMDEVNEAMQLLPGDQKQ